ncbi:hypothetical protein [Simplicispira piscis]
MATRQPRRSAVEEEATLPQMPPPAHQGLGSGLDAGFVWQQLSDIQKSLGAIQATLQQHTSAIEKVDEKLSDKTEKLEEKLGSKLSKIDSDVSEFKQIRHTAKVVAWMVGVASAGVLAVAGFIAKEAWGVFKPHSINATQQQPVPLTIPKP